MRLPLRKVTRVFLIGILCLPTLVFAVSTTTMVSPATARGIGTTTQTSTSTFQNSSSTLPVTSLLSTASTTTEATSTIATTTIDFSEDASAFIGETEEPVAVVPTEATPPQGETTKDFPDTVLAYLDRVSPNVVLLGGAGFGLLLILGLIAWYVHRRNGTPEIGADWQGPSAEQVRASQLERPQSLNPMASLTQRKLIPSIDTLSPNQEVISKSLPNPAITVVPVNGAQTNPAQPEVVSAEVVPVVASQSSIVLTAKHVPDEVRNDAVATPLTSVPPPLATPSLRPELVVTPLPLPETQKASEEVRIPTHSVPPVSQVSMLHTTEVIHGGDEVLIAPQTLIVDHVSTASEIPETREALIPENTRELPVAHAIIPKNDHEDVRKEGDTDRVTTKREDDDLFARALFGEEERAS